MNPPADGRPAVPASPKTRDIENLRKRRVDALRRHALAIAIIIDDVQPSEIGMHKPGDVVQILPGQPHAGALVRVTKVLDRDLLRGHLLAASYKYRAGMRLPDISAAQVRNVGHAPEAVEEQTYPLHEAKPMSFLEQAEAARIGFLQANQEKRERKVASSRKRRSEANLAKRVGPARAEFWTKNVKGKGT